MAPVFIFAEQVRSIVRSGKKEIEIPEGARISSAAADLIKEHEIQIKTVAPGEFSTDKTSKVDQNKRDMQTSETTGPHPTHAESVEFTEDELEEIVNRVLQRFKQLKGTQGKQTVPVKTVAARGDADPNEDDLIICRCEEITQGEIKDAIRNGMQTLNGIKRITRAGMGLCQGQTCQGLVARILTKELGLSAAEIDPTTARGPVRPLRLGVFANS